MIVGPNPLFTVVVPVYNHDRYIGLALDSLLAQTDPDWEAVVVNDGSTDNTAAIVDDYARRDARIRVFHKANGGVSSALNRGLAEARGQWVCWLSSDDLFEPGKLAVHREAATREPAIRFFFTHFRMLQDETGERLDTNTWVPIPSPGRQLIQMLNCPFVSGISVCIDRMSLVATGGFDETMRSAQDYDMWLRLMQRHEARFLPERTCISRIHAAQGLSTRWADCFLESGRSAIAFVNRHPWSELFPQTDLSDEDAAVAAFSECASVAANEGAFLYKLGAHPALLFRMLEWLTSPAAHSCRDRCRAILNGTGTHVLRYSGDATLRFCWALAQRVSLRNARPFVYRPVSPRSVAEVRVRQPASPGGIGAESVAGYLRQTQNWSPADSRQPPVAQDVLREWAESVGGAPRGLHAGMGIQRLIGWSFLGIARARHACRSR